MKFEGKKHVKFDGDRERDAAALTGLPIDVEDIQDILKGLETECKQNAIHPKKMKKKPLYVGRRPRTSAGTEKEDTSAVQDSTLPVLEEDVVAETASFQRVTSSNQRLQGLTISITEDMDSHAEGPSTFSRTVSGGSSNSSHSVHFVPSSVRGRRSPITSENISAARQPSKDARRHRDLRSEIKKMRDNLFSSCLSAYSADVWSQVGCEADYRTSQYQLAKELAATFGDIKMQRRGSHPGLEDSSSQNGDAEDGGAVDRRKSSKNALKPPSPRAQRSGSKDTRSGSNSTLPRSAHL
jgi:hypothetical protein